MFSFTKSKKTQDLSPYLRRICDATTPNLTMSPELVRSENRYNRTIPTLVCGWSGERPNLDFYTFGLTSDLSDRGVGVVVPEPFHGEQVLLGIWLDSEMEEPWFFIGDTRRLTPIGGGYWMLGVSLTEFANEGRNSIVAKLTPLAEQLRAVNSAEHEALQG